MSYLNQREQQQNNQRDQNQSNQMNNNSSYVNPLGRENRQYQNDQETQPQQSFNTGPTNRQLLQQNVPHSYGVQQFPSIPTSVFVPQISQKVNYQGEQRQTEQRQPDYRADVKQEIPQYMASSLYVEDPQYLSQRQDQFHQGLTSQLEKNKASQTEKLINWCTYIWPILFLMISLFLMSQLLYTHQSKLTSPDEAKGILAFVINNLQQTPMIDIVSIESPSNNVAKIIVPEKRGIFHHFSKNQHHNKHDEDTPQGCPAGYNIASLGLWAGVRSGCLCDDGTTHSRVYCTFHTGGQCQTIKQKDSQEMKQWKNQKICIKAVTDWSWVGTQGCKAGYKQCQIGLCVAATDPCPLSSLTRTLLTTLDPKTTITIAGVNYIKNNDIHNQPIVSFSITPGAEENAPCFNSDISPAFQSTKFYPLSYQPQSGCEQKTEGYTFQIDNEPVNDFYFQNNLQDTFNNIPYYNTYIDKDDTYNLQTVQRINLGGDAACNSLSSKNLNIVLVGSSQLYSIIKIISFIVIILCAVGLVCAMFLFMMRERQMDTCHMNEVHQTKFIYIISLVAAVLLIVLCSIYIHNVDRQNGLKDQHSIFQQYISKQCFIEHPIQTTIDQIDKFSSSTYSTTEVWIKTAFGVSIGFLVVGSILVLIQHYLYREPWCFDPWKQQ